MGAMIPQDMAWRSSHYLAVYGVLAAFMDSGIRQLPPGTEGILGRAEAHFFRAGDRDAAARIAAISILVFRLRQALLARAEAEYAEVRMTLTERTRDWLLAAPLFPKDPPLELVA